MLHMDGHIGRNVYKICSPFLTLGALYIGEGNCVWVWRGRRRVVLTGQMSFCI